ncbi:1-acyl-sn-glycerol-3-phosphate acyltransferase [Nocardioides sp. TRM66260-LWL]|uniref:lysophospholipid acyltransferase family protein n=1 Tax=Nocardioides sp. TRM66260-LWL TaxID=2874478 RepID=UPI001CC795EB|nr:lysophospholipid acyltransferase family protein [Nocardioides sp. TRM66260-LWL]MBZ5735222.1 1-acyl-sn-glycerol-3-phosphate acyltransferase [Nocardioides sp. TRM66260-LWL]
MRRRPVAPTRDERWYERSIRTGERLFAALRLDVRIEGARAIPVHGPVVLASTHSSFLDFLFVGQAGVTRGRYVRFLTRHDIWSSRPVARAMDGMRHVPVDRAAPAGAYLQARRLLREGEAVGIFPEGGVAFSSTVRHLMPGSAALAAETGAPLVPVALWGGNRLWPAGPKVDGRIPRPDLTRGRRVDVLVGEPIAVPRDADPREVTERLGHVLTGMLHGLQRAEHHRPRADEHAWWHPAHLGGQAPDPVVSSSTLENLPFGAVSPTWHPWPGSRPPAD